jgi:hypothetical protein
MRIFDVAVRIGLIGLALGLSSAWSFDGKPSDAPPAGPAPGPSLQSLEVGRPTPPLAAVPPSAAAPRPPGAIPQAALPPAAMPRSLPTPIEALRSGTQALRDGKTDQAVTALEYAAEQGMPGAMWKLGRMYADGDGVDQNKLRAFEYFRNLTKAHAYDPPGTPQARFVASAFVALGSFYLQGIPDSAVKADPIVAHEMFRYAASYFADPEAQYHLGRLYLQGQGTPKDGIQAARWLRLAALKGQRSAQALLGSMLFKGQDISRQAAMGLFWLTVAKQNAGPEDAWITETYNGAFAQASGDERALAHRYLEDWGKTRRE